MTSWKIERSVTNPILLDDFSSKNTIYIRKDISEKTETDNFGNEYVIYEYYERQFTKEEWTIYTLTQEQTEELKRYKAQEAIDEYTLQLIEEGIL